MWADQDFFSPFILEESGEVRDSVGTAICLLISTVEGLLSEREGRKESCRTAPMTESRALSW